MKPPVKRLRRSAASSPTVRPSASGGSALEAVVDALRGEGRRAAGRGRGRRPWSLLSGSACCIVCNGHCACRLPLSNIPPTPGQRCAPAPTRRPTEEPRAIVTPSRTADAADAVVDVVCARRVHGHVPALPARAASPTCRPSTGPSAAPSPTSRARSPRAGHPRAGSAGSAPTASATTSSRRSRLRRRHLLRTARSRAPHRHLLPHGGRPGDATPTRSRTTGPGPPPPRCRRTTWTWTRLRAGRVLHLSGITAGALRRLPRP